MKRAQTCCRRVISAETGRLWLLVRARLACGLGECDWGAPTFGDPQLR